MTASLSGVFSVQQFTDTGAPASGYRLYTYSPSTTTHKVAYTDAAASVPHTYTSDGAGGLYIGLNSRGELPAPLYLTSGGYDICLKTAAGVTVWTRRATGTDDTATAADTAIRADLADTTDDSKGGSLIGFNWARNYAANTLGNAVKFAYRSSAMAFLSSAQKADVLAYGYSQDLATTLGNALSLCKCLYLPAGGYKISSTLTMAADGSGLFGDGDLTVINYTGSGTAIDYNGKDRCIVEGVKLTTSTGAVGIDLPFASHFWQIDRCHIYGFSTAGARDTSSYYGTLSRCDIEQCAVGFLGVQDCNGNFINNNSFRGNLRGIWIRDVALNSDGNQIINNEFEDSGRAGVLSFVDIEGADGTIVMGNRLECSVTGLTANVYVHGGTGIAKGNKIAFNYIAGSSTGVPSIKIGAGSGAGCWDTVVEQNTCHSADGSGYAIRVESDALYAQIIGHRRQLGDGVYNVYNNSTTTALTWADDASFQVSITGLTTTPTAQWRYQVANGAVTCFAQTISGTSNSTACTITGIPSLIRPLNPQYVIVTVIDNGTTQIGRGVVDSTGTITLGKDVTGAAFTNTGTKGLFTCVMTWPIN